MKFIGTSSLSRKTQEKLEQLVSKDVDVLLEGERGSGRDYCVRFILGEETYTKIDCGQLLQELSLAERSELHHLYLDNVEDLSTSDQALVLKSLESRIFEIQNKFIKVRGRIVFSASVDIAKIVMDGKFREDLYRKISTIKVGIPSLRERKEDILLFANYFLSVFNQKHGKKIETISENLESFLLDYSWPGNISQLESFLEGLVVFSKGKVLERKSIPNDFLEKSALPFTKQLNIIPGVTMDLYEKEIIRTNLLFNAGNREKTAKVLGISERTLYRKIKEYHLNTK